MPEKQPQVEIKMNIPELITFKFNDPKTGQGQHGTWYLYGVENRGEDKVFFPTEYLNEKIRAFAPLQGKTLEIVKTEGEGKSVVWLVNVPGQVNVPVQPENPVEVKNEAKNDPLQTDLQRRVAALELSRVNAIAAYKKLEDKLKNLEALVSTLTGENAVAVHTSIAPKATVQQAAEILGGRVEGEWDFPKKS